MKRSSQPHVRDRKKRRPETRSVMVDFAKGDGDSDGDSASDEFFAASGVPDAKLSATEATGVPQTEAEVAADNRIAKAKDYLKQLMAENEVALTRRTLFRNGVRLRGSINCKNEMAALNWRRFCRPKRRAAQTIYRRGLERRPSSRRAAGTGIFFVQTRSSQGKTGSDSSTPRIPRAGKLRRNWRNLPPRSQFASTEDTT